MFSIDEWIENTILTNFVLKVSELIKLSDFQQIRDLLKTRDSTVNINDYSKISGLVKEVKDLVNH